MTRNLKNSIITLFVAMTLTGGIAFTQPMASNRTLDSTHESQWTQRQEALDNAVIAINTWGQSPTFTFDGSVPDHMLLHFATLDAWGGIQYDNWSHVVEDVGSDVAHFEQWQAEEVQRRNDLLAHYRTRGFPTLGSFSLNSNSVNLPRCADASPVPVNVETLLSSGRVVMRQGRATYSVTARTGFKILRDPHTSHPEIRHSSQCFSPGKNCSGQIEDRCTEGNYCGGPLYVSGRIRTACGPDKNNKKKYNQSSRSISFRWRLFRDQDDDF